MVVDDEPMVRNFVGGYLDTAPAIEVVGTAANGVEALEQYTLHYPEVVLMDLAMPVMDGFEATARLAAMALAPKIAVLTTLDAGDDVARAVAAGAVGYIFKNEDPQALAAAILRIAAGDGFMSGGATATLLAQIHRDTTLVQRSQARERVALLSPQEFEAAKLVIEDLTDQQIAARMFLSETTVKSHLKSARRKLGVGTRTGLALAVDRALR